MANIRSFKEFRVWQNAVLAQLVLMVNGAEDWTVGGKRSQNDTASPRHNVSASPGGEKRAQASTPVGLGKR